MPCETTAESTKAIGRGRRQSLGLGWYAPLPMTTLKRRFDRATKHGGALRHHGREPGERLFEPWQLDCLQATNACANAHRCARECHGRTGLADHDSGGGFSSPSTAHVTRRSGNGDQSAQRSLSHHLSRRERRGHTRCRLQPRHFPAPLVNRRSPNPAFLERSGTNVVRPSSTHLTWGLHGHCADLTVRLGCIGGGQC
jgi:hypothetical protein